MKTSENVFLVGLMGAGKTTAGRHLAAELAKTFHDTDHEIERRTGVRISLIFDIEGEAGFRAREKQVVDQLTQLANVVLATGGGVVLDPDNRRHLAERGVVVYLHGQPKDLWYRTRHDKMRPLLQDTDPLEKLRSLYLQRDALYREIADVVIDTGRQSARALLHHLLPQLRERCTLSA
ncbi:MAG: shikimate kinase [Betaproteobacteria bacterium]|nr:MAG: shikimate kinase [Betaproteobacteria bacterium]